MASLQKEKEDTKSNFEKVVEGLKHELNTMKEESTKTAQELTKLQSEFNVQQEALNDLRNKERQVYTHLLCYSMSYRS